MRYLEDLEDEQLALERLRNPDRRWTLAELERADGALRTARRGLAASEEAYRVATDLFRVGKTTTTELLGAIFRTAGRAVDVAGNVGRPLTSLRPEPAAWIVCELSSFQLEDVHELRPRVAVPAGGRPRRPSTRGTAPTAIARGVAPRPVLSTAAWRAVVPSTPHCTIRASPPR